MVVLSCNTNKKIAIEKTNKSSIDFKVDSVLTLMTLEEKIGQMNQYNGFWDVTGPTPKDVQPQLNTIISKKDSLVQC